MQPRTDLTDAGRVAWFACQDATCPEVVTAERRDELQQDLGDTVQRLMRPQVAPEPGGGSGGQGGRREPPRWRLRVQLASPGSGEVSPDRVHVTRGAGRADRQVVSVALTPSERLRLDRLASVHGSASEALRAGLELLEAVEVGRGRLPRADEGGGGGGVLPSHMGPTGGKGPAGPNSRTICPNGGGLTGPADPDRGQHFPGGSHMEWI